MTRPRRVIDDRSAIGLLAAGLLRMHKLRAGVFADKDTETAGITLSGRF